MRMGTEMALTEGSAETGPSGSQDREQATGDWLPRNPLTQAAQDRFGGIVELQISFGTGLKLKMPTRPDRKGCYTPRLRTHHSLAQIYQTLGEDVVEAY